MMRLIVFLVLFLPAVCYSQGYIMPQDFSGASGSEMPSGWRNYVIVGDEGTDTWRFDNPGGRSVLFPMAFPFAIFDAGAVSTEGQIQEVALESAAFNASVSNDILLMFDHTFDPGTGESARVEVFDGDQWYAVEQWQVASLNPQSVIVNISARAGGVDGARVRFVWQGTGTGFWAIDNIRVYAARPLDAAMLEINRPVMPFGDGQQMVGISLGNFGSENLTSTTISWEADGVSGPDINWSGNLAFGQVDNDISLGLVDFQGPVQIKAWQRMPNGGVDANTYNDTIVRVLRPSLHGTYTIGGVDADFEDFSEAVAALQASGVAGAVQFIVRQGSYQNQLIFNHIQGSSSINTITFQAENGNPETTRLYFTEWLQTAVRFRNCAFIHFRNIGISGHHAVEIEGQSASVSFEGCSFTATGTAVGIYNGSENISLIANMFHGSEHGVVAGDGEQPAVELLTIGLNTFRNISKRAITLTNVGYTNVSNNNFFDVPAGIMAYGTAHLTINNNRIIQLSGFGAENRGVFIDGGEETSIFNNFIYTRGSASSTGISLLGVSNSRVFFNTVNVTNTNAGADSRALHINGGGQLDVSNNIFCIGQEGFPVDLTGTITGLSLDHNNLYSGYGMVGRAGNVSYYQLSEWQNATTYDANSLSVNPFFTDPAAPYINQVLLSGAAVLVANIPADIDGNARKIPPDIGAWEYNPCETDAGINLIYAPARSVEPGPHMISAELQNQGTSILNEATIKWSVDGIEQGNLDLNNLQLAVGASLRFDLGLYNFQKTFSFVRAWTEKPNGIDDCNLENDMATLSVIARGTMCGEYTIGGDDPHFINFSEALLALRTSGISCDVVFKVRDGVYNEQIVIRDFPGSSGGYSVTFESESGDNTAVLLQYPFDGQAPLRLVESQHITFRGIGLNGFNGVLVEGTTVNTVFDQCHFSVTDSQTDENWCLGITGLPQGIDMTNNTFTGGHQAIRINTSSMPVQPVVISGNVFAGQIREAIRVTGSGNVRISYNQFGNLSRAIYASNASGLEIYSNRVSLVSGSGTENTGFDIRLGIQIRIYNNTILAMGDLASTGIRFENVSESGIFFNSISMQNRATSGNTRALWLQHGNNNMVLNNIFYIASAGYPVHLEGTIAPGTLNHNNLFSAPGLIGRYNQANYFSVGSWSAAAGQDSESLSENPFFGPDFSVNQSLLDGKGIPAGGIVDDINNMPRDAANPDPGALEFDPVCANDAGINWLVSPAGVVRPEAGNNTLPVTVYLQNHGTAALNSVRILWEVTSGALTESFSYDWSGSVESGNGIEVTVGQYDFRFGLYSLKLSTIDPNGTDDCNSLNDMVQAEVVASLSGDYTIGGNNPDFIDFSTAASVLNAAGIAGNVRFLVRAGDYNERFVIGNVFGTDTDNTVSFLPETGSEGNVHLIAVATDLPILTFRNASHIYFTGIGFRGNRAVVMEELSSNIHFADCTFITGKIALELKSGTSDITIEGNSFTRLSGTVRPDHYIFLRWDTDGWNMAARFENIIIRDNIFSEPGMEAIHAFGAKNMIIEANHFDDIRRGILANDIEGLVINANWMYIVTAAGQSNIGMVIEDGTDVMIYNNFIHSRGSHQVTGIRISRNSDNQVYFNTINITNSHNESKAFWLDNSAASEVKNNIFNIKHTGYPFYIIQPDLLISDYNNYYSTDGVIGFFGAPISNLAVWGAALGGDSNSSDLNPLFDNDEHPLPSEKFLNGAGYPVSGIEYDIFGATRDPSAPDIGCMEFVIDYAVSELILPGMDCELSDQEQVIVRITRPGEIPLDQIRVDMQINGQTFPGENISGIFDDFVDYTFPGTYDFSALGEYEIIVWLVNTRDDNVNNDQRIFYRILQESPVTDIEAVPLCSYVAFSPLWRTEEDPATEFLWDFGDGNTSVEQQPDHIYSASGNYAVSLMVTTSLGCFTYLETSIDVQVPETPLQAMPDIVQQYCAGVDDASILLNISGGTVPYRILLDGIEQPAEAPYIFADLSPGTYSFEIIDANNCSWADELVIQAALPMDPEIVLPAYELYAPADVPLSYTSNRAVDSLHWEGNNQQSDATNPVFVFDEPGTYTITLQAFTGTDMVCSEETTKVIEVLLREMSIEVTPNQKTCVGYAPASIKVSIDGGTMPFVVSLNDRDTIITIPARVEFTDLPPGPYTIRVEDRYHQVIQTSATIDETIAMYPVIHAEMDYGISPVDIEFWFEADNVQHWLWIYGNETSTEARPVFSFRGETEHIVELVVYSGNPADPSICTEYAEPFVVTTEQKVVMNVGGVITPNGDGVNDFFEVEYKNLSGIEVDIFDRRGMWVYGFYELDGRWFGNYENGMEAPDGVYNYYIRGVGLDGYEHTKSGMVQLIRETISLFPNPAQLQVTIDVKGRVEVPYDIGLYDTSGNHMASFRHYDGSSAAMIDISGLPEGLYIVRVSANNRIIHGRLHIIR